MAAQPSYYDVLGLPRTASLDEIKKRYRELARQHHPDMNRDKPDTAKRFAEITTAYKTLSHPDDRAAYDADLALRERRAATEAARSAANTFPGTSTNATTGTGEYARAGARGGPTMGRNTAPLADVARLLDEAQAAFVRMKFIEARALCEQVLRRDRRNARAYEILGDVYRVQNRTDDAINMYTMALQFNPRNHPVMQRLERLSRGASPSGVRYARPTGPRPAPAPGHSPAPDLAPPRPDRRSILLLMLRLFGGILILFLIFGYLGPDQGDPLKHISGPVSAWSAKLIFVMGLSGLIVGFLLAATAAVRRIEDELILSGGRFLPLGLFVVVVSVFFFYAAALLYTIAGLIQESFSVSMAVVFGAVFAVVLLLTVVYAPGRTEVFWFGGNVIFLSLIIGWFFGDLFRPNGW